MSLAQSLGSYRLKIRNQLEQIMEKLIKVQLEKIAYVKTIQKELDELMSDQGLERMRSRTKEMERALSDCRQEMKSQDRALGKENM